MIFIYFPQNNYFAIYFSVFNFCQDFFAGAIVFLFTKKFFNKNTKGRKKSRFKILESFISILLFFLALISLNGYYHYSKPLYYLLDHCALTMLSCILIFRASHGINFTNKKHFSKILHYFADRSYTLYILHLSVLGIVSKVLNNYDFHTFWKISLVILSILFLTHLIYKFIELPLILFSRKKFRYNT